MSSIHIRYARYGEPQQVSLPHVAGKTLKSYFHEVQGLMGIRCYGGFCVRNGKGEKVRMYYEPSPNELIRFEKVAHALSK